MNQLPLTFATSAIGPDLTPGFYFQMPHIEVATNLTIEVSFFLFNIFNLFEMFSVLHWLRCQFQMVSAERLRKKANIFNIKSR